MCKVQGRHLSNAHSLKISRHTESRGTHHIPCPWEDNQLGKQAGLSPTLYPYLTFGGRLAPVDLCERSEQ